MSRRPGRKAKLYWMSAGTWASPTWTEITLVRDLTNPMTRAQIDASVRGDTFKLFLTDMLEAGADFQMAFDEDNASFIALEDAFVNETANLVFAVMSGPITTGTERGLKAECKVTDFTRTEDLAGMQVVDVAIRPAADYTDAPTWLIVAT